MRSQSPDNAIVHCYAQRLLNPFRGVTNVVRYQSAEAVTMDGVHWDIYVANDALRQGLDLTHNIQISDIRRQLVTEPGSEARSCFSFR